MYTTCHLLCQVSTELVRVRCCHCQSGSFHTQMDILRVAMSDAFPQSQPMYSYLSVSIIFCVVCHQNSDKYRCFFFNSGCLHDSYRHLGIITTIRVFFRAIRIFCCLDFAFILVGGLFIFLYNDINVFYMFGFILYAFISWICVVYRYAEFMYENNDEMCCLLIAAWCSRCIRFRNVGFSLQNLVLLFYFFKVINT